MAPVRPRFPFPTTALLPNPLRVGALLLIALFLASVPGAESANAQAAEYRLMVNDQIQLQVVEWRAETATPQTWDALTRAYTVDSSGNINVPLLGVLNVAGLTTHEVGTLVAAQLQAVVGLVDPPGTAVEILRYNPVIISGLVQAPGALPYTPGMTVGSAFALAGGEPRAAEAELRASTQTTGAVARAREILARQLAREARLIAERDDNDTINFPVVLGHPEGALAERQIKDTETAVFETRRNGLKREIEGLEDLQRLYVAEEDSLLKKRISLDTIMTLTESRLKKLEALAEDGLVPGAQLLETQRSVVDLQTQSLNIDLALFRARAQISIVSRQRVATAANRVAEIADFLALTRSEITAQQREIVTNRNILDTYADNMLILAEQGVNSHLQFDLLRHGENQTRRVDLATLLVPGDVITVTRVAADGMDDSGTGSPPDPISEPDTDATLALPTGSKQKS